MNDDELLRRLSDAFAAEPCPPPAIGLQALHQSIDDARTTLRPIRSPRRRWLLLAVATASAIGIGNLTLAATGTTLPKVFRAAAPEVHLSADSPALLETRGHFSELRRALDRDDLAAIDKQMRLLRTSFNRLDVDERRSISVEVLEILAVAQTRLARPSANPVTETPPPTTAPPVSSPGDSQEPVGPKPTNTSDATDDANESGQVPATSVVNPTPDTPEDQESTQSVEDHDSANLDAADVADG